ncbi:MarR family transcriptional regulator [Streptomyces geysiriensis]|uniref:MarR family winged helix-turn-helix transcriptional regulator n=1 Tax=Streptomyces TaxID=1883 RepID=UPI000FB6090C|nr:MarR family transcriptional regulator [Streptomyces sp. WAC06128]RSS73750.1 MarR family transcriptional regulator [Streptomyces sp. WAC06128]GGY60368.1 MarR family transcriptional regulator [Streptomyces geysiriensis]
MAARTAGARLEERWREILSVHARTMCEIDRALHPHGLGASDFEVLDLLVTEGPEDGSQCRVQNLVGRVHLSQSALSRLIARLEKDGLVERSMCAEDRRGVYVALTCRGRELHARVLPLQRAVLARMLGDEEDARARGRCPGPAAGV